MNTPSMTFHCKLRSDGEMSAIPIAFDPRAVFGKVRAPVVVAINAYEYRSTVFTMRGETFVPLRTSHREAAGVAQGGTYEVTLTLDTAPRTVAVPDELVAALDAADAHAGWDCLSFTAQRELVEGIETARREETRAKRLAAAVTAAVARTP